MNQAELVAQLDALKAQVDKSKAEIVAKVADLEAELANAGQVSPEVEARLNALKSAVQAVDDLNPDAPASEPGAPADGT
jgi:hypothetical protein